MSVEAAFSMGRAAEMFFVVIIGGIGTLIYFALRKSLGDYGTRYLIVLGMIAVILMLKFPKGIWGIARARYGLWVFAVARRLVVNKK